MKSRNGVLTAIAATSMLSAIGACGMFGKGPHVPSAYQGTAKITVVNASDAEMCGFSVFAGSDKGENWLGESGKLESVAPGAQRSFDIKPGTYHVVAALFLARARGGTCANGEFLAGAGTYGDATVEVKGASLITIGPKDTPQIAGTELIAFPKFFAETGGVTSEAPAEAAPACKPVGTDVKGFDECCSGKSRATRTSEPGGPYKCCESGPDCH